MLANITEAGQILGENAVIDGRPRTFSAITRLALSGCTEAEIGAISGHSLRDIRSILDANYLHRDPAPADNTIAKLERGTKSPN